MKQIDSTIAALEQSLKTNIEQAQNFLGKNGSTGPKTPEGKRRSSQNALKHGLTAEKHTTTIFEKPGEFEVFKKEIHACFEPATPYERALVDRIASLMWRLKRIPAMESELLNWNAQQGPRAFALAWSNGTTKLANLSRYETHLDRSLHRTLRELRQAQETRQAQEETACTMATPESGSVEMQSDETNPSTQTSSDFWPAVVTPKRVLQNEPNEYPTEHQSLRTKHQAFQ